LKSVYNIAIDLQAQARAQKTGSRSEAQSILLSMPENATLRSRQGREHIINRSPPHSRQQERSRRRGPCFPRHHERQRNEAERRKAETLEQLGLLAGGIAHDFNNLLTAIIGNISLASLLLPPNDRWATRSTTPKRFDARPHLAQQLLTFAVGAPIKENRVNRQTDLGHIKLFAPRSHSRSEFLLPPTLPGQIDPGQITRVIANLVERRSGHANGGTLRAAATISATTRTPPAHPGFNAGRLYSDRYSRRSVGISEDCLSEFSIRISRRSRRQTVSVSRPPIRSSRTTTVSSRSIRRSFRIDLHDLSPGPRHISCPPNRHASSTRSSPAPPHPIVTTKNDPRPGGIHP